MSLTGKPFRDIQRKIWQMIALLRLYAVGSVNYIEDEMWSNSFAEYAGAFGPFCRGRSNLRHRAIEKYILGPNDEERLRAFVREVASQVPEAFYEDTPGGVDHKAIAYQRYSDGLSFAGMEERRIAFAVMGLEALFLKPSEMGGLSYLLKMRAAKFLAAFGRRAGRVRDAVKLGYRIRSDFVHGSPMGAASERTAENQFGGVKALTTFLLDCLRVGIVACLLSPHRKAEMIDCIDNALLSGNTLDPGESARSVLT